MGYSTAASGAPGGTAPAPAPAVMIGGPVSVRSPWLRAAAAAVAATALLVPASVATAEETPSPSASPALISATPTSFTVGITDDVDSMNPYTGIVSTAYEMYQLMYPTLTGYGADDFAAVPDLAESWGRPVMLSGSGPSLYGFFLDADEAADAAAAIPIGARFAEACALSTVGWRIGA